MPDGQQAGTQLRRFVPTPAHRMRSGALRGPGVAVSRAAVAPPWRRRMTGSSASNSQATLERDRRPADSGCPPLGYHPHSLADTTTPAMVR
jgi:hypothetical protein